MNSVRLERWIARKFRRRHVELIAELVDSRSILKACKRLNLTQPTVTRALQDVEPTLGVPLFTRTNRGLEPTPYGEIFARHAKIVLAQLRHAADVPELRTTSTLEGLREAVEAELLDSHDADELAAGWTMATRARNAVTLVKGKPTDQLPRSGRELAAVARILGYPPDASQDLVEDYRRTARRARAVMERLFYG